MAHDEKPRFDPLAIERQRGAMAADDARARPKSLRVCATPATPCPIHAAPRPLPEGWVPLHIRGNAVAEQLYRDTEACVGSFYDRERTVREELARVREALEAATAVVDAERERRKVAEGALGAARSLAIAEVAAWLEGQDHSGFRGDATWLVRDLAQRLREHGPLPLQRPPCANPYHQKSGCAGRESECYDLGKPEDPHDP